MSLPVNLEDSSDFFRSLHYLSLELSKVGTLKELYREAVRLGRERLDLDRLAILLIDPDRQQIQGTFGTDETGALVDETDFRSEVPTESAFIRECLARRDYVGVWENTVLTNRDEQVGVGWYAMAALWDGEKPFGWLACDNLLRHKPLGALQKELIGLYGTVVGGLILRCRHELDLESKIDEKTRELKERVTELENARTHLAELDKLASLGGLVAGVAHEINTPIGNSVTANSFIKGELAGTLGAYRTKTLGARRLEQFFEDLGTSVQILETNLDRAARLIQNFKQLAVTQSFDDTPTEEVLSSLVESVSVSFSYQLRTKSVTWKTDLDPNLCLVTWPGTLVQVLTNLVVNSLLHGFEGRNSGTITVRAWEVEGSRKNRPSVELEYSDDGMGIPPQVRSRLFEPFVTTKRGKGGTGLGLSIVYSLVTGRLGGRITPLVPESGGSGFLVSLPRYTVEEAGFLGTFGHLPVR